MKIRIKIQGGLMFLGMATVILFSNFTFLHKKQDFMDVALNAVGMGLILLGFLFRIAARGYKEEKSSNGNVLVKSGPYAIIRNPMYFGTFIIGAGVVMMLLEWWFFLLFSVIFLLIYIPQIKKEEKALLERFGQEYKEYCRITPKYFLRFDYLLRLDRYVSLKSFWIQKEIVPMLTTINVVILIEIWEYTRLCWSK